MVHLTRFLLPWLLLTGSWAAQAQDQHQAGTVLYAFGDVQALNVAGGARALGRGGVVLSGDTVKTGDGRTQVRFSDGGAVALQPNTTFRVEDYRYPGHADGSERSFLNLVRGSIRFVTGVIGHDNRANYKIRTAVATIGIRGSGGRADLCEGGSCGDRADGLYLTGNQDVITLTNEHGTVDVRPGDTFFAPCPGCPITRIDAGPTAHVDLHTQQKSPAQDYARGDDRSDDGATVAVSDGRVIDQPSPPPPPPPGPTIIPLASGTGGGSIGAVGDNGSATAGLLGGTLTFDTKGALTQYVDGSIPSNTYTASTVTHFGADGIVAWGLWTAGTAGGGYASGLGTTNLLALPYVVSLSSSATPAATLAAVNGTYNIYASTPPIAISGGSIAAIGSPDSVSGAFNVNFSANTVGYNFSFPLASQTFTLQGTASFINNSPGSGDSRFLGGGTITSGGPACASPCSGLVPFGPNLQGYVTGTGGERLGSNYAFSSAIGTVAGAVVAKP